MVWNWWRESDEKASQALKENAPSIRKQIGQESQQGVETTLAGDEGFVDNFDESYAVIKPEQPVTSSDYPSKFPTGSLQRLPCGALQQVPSSSASNQQNLSSLEDAPSTDAPSSPFESFLAEMLDNTKPSAQGFHERTTSHPVSQQPFPCEASSQLWPSSASSCDRATLSIMQDYAQWFPHSPSVSHHQVTGSFSFEGSFPEVSCSSNYNIQDPSFYQRATSHSMQQNSHAVGASSNNANSYHRAHGAMAVEATKPGATNGISRISSYEDRSQRKRIKISSSQTSSFPLSPIRLLRETLPSYPVQYEHPNYSYYPNGNGGGSYGQQHSTEQYAPFHLFIDNFPSNNNHRPTNAASNCRRRTSHQGIAGNTNRSFDFAPSSQQLRSVSNSAEQGEDYDSFHSLS